MADSDEEWEEIVLDLEPELLEMIQQRATANNRTFDEEVTAILQEAIDKLTEEPYTDE